MSPATIDLGGMRLISYCRHNAVTIAKLLKENEFSSDACALAKEVRDFFETFINWKTCGTGATALFCSPEDSLRIHIMVYSAAKTTLGAGAQKDILITTMKEICESIIESTEKAETMEHLGTLQNFFGALSAQCLR